MKSESSSLSRVSAPPGVWWREFRIQIMHWLAFGGALFLAGVLWVKAVLPVAVEPQGDPPPELGQASDPAPALGTPLVHEPAHGATNAMVKSHDPRD